MLHAGLDLSRNRLDICLLSDQGELVDEFAAPSDHDGVRALARRVLDYGQPVRAVKVSKRLGGRRKRLSPVTACQLTMFHLGTPLRRGYTLSQNRMFLAAMQGYLSHPQ